MEEKQRQTINRNYFLLVKNILLTEEFYDCLRRENVLPETMIRDIESRSTREERNSRLLENLKLRGGDAYRKFRHVLYLTGHTFLADHLHGEDGDIKILKGDELFSKFPSAFDRVSDDVKSKVLKYLETKVRERSLTTAWLKSGPERTELMEARKVCYDNEKDFRFRLNAKNKKIQTLREEASQLTTHLKERNQEVNNLKKDIDNMKQNFKEELNKQTRFNAANNHSVLQLRQRFDSFNERIKILNFTINEFLEDKGDGNADEHDNLKISTLETNIMKLLRFMKKNEQTTSSSLSERDSVLRMLRTSSCEKNQPLSEVVKSYIEKEEKGKLSLYHEFERLLEIIRGKRTMGKSYAISEQVDLKLLKSQVATLRVEVEHVKKKLDWKDSHLSDLIQENTALRSNLNRRSTSGIKFPRVSATKSRASPTKSVGSPDSNVEMEKLYQQFDRYISDSGYTSPPCKLSRLRTGLVADVNLERDFSPPPLPVIRSRRSSRIDNVELDILGTGRRPSRNVIFLETTNGGSHVNATNHEKTMTRSGKKNGHEVLDKHTEAEPVRNESHQNTNADKQHGQPSLAELIASYENISVEE